MFTEEMKTKIVRDFLIACYYNKADEARAKECLTLVRTLDGIPSRDAKGHFTKKEAK